MSKKTLTILIIALIVIVVALGLWWYFSRPANPNLPAQPNQPAKPAGAIINPVAVNPATTLPADQRTSQDVILDNLARNFGERIGSYSTENMVQAKALVATLPVSSQIINSLITPLPKQWQAVSTRVLKSDFTSTDANSRQYTLSTQRSWQGFGNQQSITYKTLVVTMKNVGGAWQITGSQWQ